MVHRLFIAIRPPQGIRRELLAIRGGIESARWQSGDQLHLTLRFVGEVEWRVAEDLAHALGQVRVPPFELAFSGVGHFERKGAPHTLWAGLAQKPDSLQALAILQHRVERACVQAGIAPETRSFKPHITLARLNRSSGPIAPFLAAHGCFSTEPWQVTNFALFESKVAQDGAHYTPVASWPL